MGGPGSGNRGSASRGGSRAGSRGGSRGGSRCGSRGGSQVRGRGRATAPTIQEQLLYEEEEEDLFRKSHQQERANDPDENEISSEEEDAVPNEQVFAHCKDGKYHHGHSDSFCNFLRYLRRCHEEEYNKVNTGGNQIPSNQSCMTNFLATKVPKDTQKKIYILLAEMIVMDNLPLTVLQRDGFRRLILFIAPTYNIPSYEKMRDTIIPSIYARTAEVVKTVLKFCDVVTIMLDLWSSNSMVGFMGVSRSSVTADYVPFTCFLNMKEIPSNHTAEAILSESECVVSDWELNGKVVRTVTDNASNMTKAFRLQLSNFILEEKEDEFIEMELEAGLEVPNYVLIPEYLECMSSAGGSQNDELEIENLMSTLEIDLARLIQENCWKINKTGFVSATSSHAGCLPHQTQLVIKDGLKAIEKFVSKSLDLLCKIVGGVRRSVVDTKVLLDSVGFKISMMNLTRWNSQFSMKDTETIGLVIPFYLDLVNQCSLDPRVNQEAKFITSCKCMAEELSRSLSKRMSWVLKDTFFVWGSVLDPRIKGTWITAAGEEEEEVIATVKELLKLRYRTIGGNEEGERIEENSGSGGEDDRRRKANDSTSATPIHKRSRQSIRSLLASVLVRPRTLSKGVSKIIDEFDNDFREPLIVNEKGQFDLDFSPCEYWKLNQHRFPALAPIAKDIMGIPCSSANIERAFSTAVDILSARSNKNKPKLFDMLVFIKRNAELLEIVSDKSRKFNDLDFSNIFKDLI
ncbi:Uncharacterized protein APZ42_028994 [Daphnia magna]|uniref:HAT C-terminal dimerisation domain-containing protein n=1 Tax=Daphnia magna TaxID=35525 RepID=A0A164Q038_9CRUS|nr:Uncharacterized protein APZ42_028994 [Daphnia magna]